MWRRVLPAPTGQYPLLGDPMNHPTLWPVARRAYFDRPLPREDMELRKTAIKGSTIPKAPSNAMTKQISFEKALTLAATTKLTLGDVARMRGTTLPDTSTQLQVTRAAGGRRVFTLHGPSEELAQFLGA